MARAIISLVVATGSLPWSLPSSSCAQPIDLYSPRTMLVARIDLESLSGARIQEAIRAVMPPGRSLPDQSQQAFMMYDGMVRGPLVGMGADRLVLLAEKGDGAGMQSAVVRAALPGGSSPEALLNHLGQLGGAMGLEPEMHAGWIVMGLTAPPLDAALGAPVDDAVFVHALDSAPDADVIIAIIPTAAMRREMINGMAAQRAKAEDAEQLALIGAASEIATADAYVFAIELGPVPFVQIDVRLRDEQTAGAVLSAFRASIATMRDEILKDAREKRGTDEEFDPEPQIAMLDEIRPRRDESALVLHLDEAALRVMVEGVISATEQLGEALGEAIGGAAGG